MAGLFSGLLSGLTGMGLGDQEGADIHEEEKPQAKKEEPQVKKEEPVKPAAPKVEEKNLVYEKKHTCPVCGEDFTSKVMKSGKARLLGTDRDLRPRYSNIDAVKYEVVLCPHCGYAALTRFFDAIGSAQAKLVRENISRTVRLNACHDDIYSYEEALERYKLCQANAVAKRAKASEKAYICLKSAWLLRGYAEYLGAEEDAEQSRIDELKAQEEAYRQNALDGFLDARQHENFPMCGMDEMTVDYLTAELATHFGKYDIASRMVASILSSSSASPRIKDKARDLKEEIMAAHKKE